VAGPKTTKDGQIVPRNGNGGAAIAPGDELRGLLQRMKGQIANALPKHLTPDRMLRVATTALSTTRDLHLSTTASFVGCVLQAAQLGLEPNTPLGHAYLIPRRSKWVEKHQRMCTLIVGYQGYIDLALRSGRVTAIYAHDVRKGDAFQYQLGLFPDLKHTPSEQPDREQQAVTHVYAVAILRGVNGQPGERIFMVLTRAQIDERRSRSDASDSGPWVTDFVAMAKKSAVRALWPWLPKSVEMATAAAVEDAAERSGSQVAAFDPEITAILQQEGVIDATDLQQQDPALTDSTTSISDEALRAAAQGAESQTPSETT